MKTNNNSSSNKNTEKETKIRTRRRRRRSYFCIGGITTQGGLTDTNIGATVLAAAAGTTTNTSMSHRQQTAQRNRNSNTRWPNRMQRIIHTTINHTKKEAHCKIRTRTRIRDGSNHYNSRNVCFIK